MLDNGTWYQDRYFNPHDPISPQIPEMTTNTTPRGVASSSSYQEGYEAYRAFDSAKTNGWYPVTSERNSWVKYEFDTLTTIRRAKASIRVYNKQGVRLYIQVSSDNVAWEDVANYATTTENGVLSFETTFDPKNIRFIRLSSPDVMYGSNGNYVGVTDLQAYN